MNKKVLVFSILLLLAPLLIFSQSKKKMWAEAITENDPAMKYEYFKKYEAKYGTKKDKMQKYLYLNLANVAFQLRKWDDVTVHGEKALTFADIEGTTRIGLYMNISNAYNITKKDIDKAFHFAGLAVELAKEMITKQQSLDQDQEKKEKFINNYKSFYIAPSLRIQTKILYAKAKSNPTALTEAATKAVEAYKNDESKKSADLVFQLAFIMYKKKLNDKSLELLEAIFNKEKPEYKHAQLLANLYFRLKNRSKAIEYFELQYRIKRKGSMALKIGKMVHKTDTEKGIKYFAEAYVLSDFDKESDAYRFLQQLHFNKKKGTDAQFKELINSTSARLGKTPPAATTGEAQAPAETATE